MYQTMTSPNKLHVVIFPCLLSSDHLIPFFELSKIISKKGHQISFVCTPQFIKCLPKLQSNLIPLINFVSFSLPQFDLSSNTSHLILEEFNNLETKMTQFLEKSSPDWIIYNFAPLWLGHVAARLGISRAFFNVTNSGCLASILSFQIKDFDGENSTLSQHCLKSADHLYQKRRDIWDVERVKHTIIECDIIVTRDCLEFEPEWLNLLKEISEKPVIQLGLMPPSLQENGDDKTFTWLAVSDWLDKQEKSSVIYVALGSNTTITQELLTELALGLELSGLRFFWALNKSSGPNEQDWAKLPSGFEQRAKGRGIVCRSWAPQLKILAHDSVGGFLTHCNWSCIIDGLMFGRPLIMLPFDIEQGLNAKIMVKKNVGVEVSRDEHDGSFTKESVIESLKLVTAEKEGKILRDKAKNMSLIFGDKVRHDQYVDRLVEYIQNYRRM